MRLSRVRAFVSVFTFFFALQVSASSDLCALLLSTSKLHHQYGAGNVPQGELTSFMNRLDSLVITNRAQFNSEIADYSKKLLGLTGSIEVTLPPIIPTSSAEVYIIKEDDKKVAVLKIFLENPLALVHELSAIRIIRDALLKKISPINVLQVGKIEIEGKQHPFIFMSVARGIEIEQIIRGVSSSHLLPAIKAVAQGLAEMHKYFSTKHVSEESQEIMQYEISRLAAPLKKEGFFTRLTQRGWLSTEEMYRVKLKVQQLILSYKKAIPYLISVIHGDSHQGNFSYDLTSDSIQVFDVQTLVWSLRKSIPEKIGIIDASADVGKFYEALAVNGILAHAPQAQIEVWQKTFLETYAQAHQKTVADLSKNLEFFRTRFIFSVLQDSKKTSEAERLLLLDKLLREWGIRASKEDKPTYSNQDRGDAESYEAYFAGMDKTMAEKIAMCTAVFPSEGTIADMGSGSGTGSAAFAGLYPGLKVIGVDINPKTVVYASEAYKMPNLSFMTGDIAEVLFPENSLDGIFNSSSLHHVTTFNGFSLEKAQQAIANQVSSLKENRIFGIRDFVIPEGPAEVYLDLPFTDGADDGEVPGLSTAALFEVFARDFRSSVHRHDPVPFTRHESPHPGFRRFKLDFRTAYEFILRKNYRKTTKNWETELLEEYTYLSQKGFESEYKKNGVRVLVSKPIYNSWLIENRYRNKFHMHDMARNLLPLPPTNYLILGEKVSSQRGVLLKEESHEIMQVPRFLKMEHYRNKITGQISDLASRPDDTFDVIPWYEDQKTVYVLARQRYPRPILNAKNLDLPVRRGVTSGYITEPITALMNDKMSREASVERILLEQGQISSQGILSMGDEFQYYSSPGGINELIHGQQVKLKAGSKYGSVLKNRSGFSESGFIQALNAQQTLRSAHIGGFFDARLEINIYNLLLDLGKSVGPWIAGNLDLSTQDNPLIKVEALGELLKRKQAVFEKTTESAGYLEVRRGIFAEEKADGTTLDAKVELEYVLPKKASRNTAVILPIIRRGRDVYVGLEVRDLPAVQNHEGSSLILTAPAWRLPKDITNMDQTEIFIQAQMKAVFKADIKKILPLGGEYYTSTGITPEIATPLAAEIDAATAAQSELRWINLEEFRNFRSKIKDGHTLVVLFRGSHALNLFK